MKILLIAPSNPNLPSVVQEVAAIASYHEVERVIGAVSENDIQQAIRKGPYDVIWWATHGGPDGLMLGATLLDPIGVGQYVVASKAALCVLNTCASEDVAFQIIAGGDANMIFTISAEIHDADALRFGGLLAAELAKTDDFEAAFEAAKGPGETKYRYLQAKEALRGMTLQTLTATEKLAAALDKFKGEMEVFSRAQYQSGVDTKATIESLRSQVQASPPRMDNLQAQIEGLRNTVEINRAHIQQQSPTPVLAVPATIVPTPNAQFSPTAWALILLIVLGLAALTFFVGRGF